MVNRLRNGVDVLPIFEKTRYKGRPRRMWRDSLGGVHLACPFSNDVAKSGVAQLFLKLTAMAILGRLEKVIRWFDFPPPLFHPGEILVDIVGGGRMNGNLVHLLAFSDVPHDSNALMVRKIREF